MRTPLLLVPLVLLGLSAADTASARVIEDSARPSRRTLLQNEYKERALHATTRPESPMALPLTFTDETVGVSIRYPAKWELQHLTEKQDNLTLVAMFLSEMQATGLRENANLVLEDVDPAMTLDEYTRIALTNEEAFLEGFALIESTRIPVAGKTAQRVRFTALGSGFPMEFEQVWFLHNGIAHIWTFVDAEETFDTSVQHFHRMLDTLLVR